MNKQQGKKVIQPLYNHWKPFAPKDVRDILLDFQAFCAKGKLIINKQGHAVPFVLNEAQTKVAELILSKAFAPIPEPVSLVIHKSRQMGISVVLAALEQYLVCRKQNINITHLFPDEQLAYQFFNEKWQPLAEGTHPSFLPDMYPTISPVPYIKVGNFHGIDMNCNIKIGGAGSPAAGRSGTNQIVILDEYAFYPNVSNLERGILATQPKAGLVMTIYVSTANGMNWFYDAVQNAQKPDSKMEHLFLPWHMLKEYEMPVKEGSRFYDLDLYHPTDYDMTLMDIFEKEGYPEETWANKLEWYDHVLDVEAKGDQEFMFSEYPSCVVAGTRVGTTDGIIPIEETYEGIVSTRGEVSQTHIQPKSPVAKLTTAKGYELIGTYDHPIKTTEGFVPLIDCAGKTAELLPPRTADKPYRVEWDELGVHCCVEATEELGEWLGYFMGDGCYSGNTLDFALCYRDKDVIRRMHELTKKLFGIELTGRRIRANGYNLRAGCKGFGPILKRLGVVKEYSGTRVRRKLCVPEIIWRSPTNIQRAFIKGLFEADGFIALTGVRNGYVKLFTKNTEFSKEIQLLLLANGLTSKRRLTIKKEHGREYPGTELYLSSWGTYKYKEIGFMGKFKNDRLAAVSKPGGNAKPIVMEDEVISVEPYGEEHTYNLTVPGDSTFDANGIWTHNTERESFEVSGRPVLPAKVTTYWLEKNKDDKLQFVDQYSEIDPRTHRPRIVIQPTNKSAVRQYQQPLPGHRYILGCDPSEGDYAGDRSAWVIVDLKTMEEVCFSADYLEAEELADTLINYAKYYNNAQIVVERNMGQAVIEYLLASNYHRIYIDPDCPGKVKYGVRTTQATKNEAIRRLRFLLNNGYYKPHDPVFLEEAQHFSWRQLPGGSWRAEAMGTDENGQPYKDDSVMSRAILSLALDMRKWNGYYKKMNSRQAKGGTLI